MGQIRKRLYPDASRNLNDSDEVLVEPRLIEVPACYDEEFADDLAEIAEKGGISIDEAVRLHSEQTYKRLCHGVLCRVCLYGGSAGSLKAAETFVAQERKFLSAALPSPTL